MQCCFHKVLLQCTQLLEGPFNRAIYNLWKVGNIPATKDPAAVFHVHLCRLRRFHSPGYVLFPGVSARQPSSKKVIK